MDAVVKAAAGAPSRRPRLAAGRPRGDLPRAVPGGRPCRLSSLRRGVARPPPRARRLVRRRRRVRRRCSPSIFPSIEGSPELDKLIESYPEALKELFGDLGAGSITSGAGLPRRRALQPHAPAPRAGARDRLGRTAARGRGGRRAARARARLPAPPARRRAREGSRSSRRDGRSSRLPCSSRCSSSTRSRPRAVARAARVGGRRLVALIALLYGWLALAVGAADGSRALAVGVPAGARRRRLPRQRPARLAGWLDPFRFLSSFWLVGTSPLENGLNWWGVLVVGLAARSSCSAPGTSCSSGATCACPGW